jgi:hypothetical protein
LQEHPCRELLLLQSRVHAHHRVPDDVGGSALQPRVDRRSLVEGAHGRVWIGEVGIMAFARRAEPVLRIYMNWPVVIADWSVPMWVSWVGLVIAGGLAFFGLRLAARDAR